MTEKYKICTKCGSRVDADYNFCPNCKSQSFKSQPVARRENSPRNLKETLLYWNYDGGIVLSKAKVGGILTFLFFFIAGMFSPVPAGVFVVALIFAGLVYFLGFALHKLKGAPSDATIQYNDYGLLRDLYHLFFFWQNKNTGEFVASKTKIISFLVFVVFALICAFSYGPATFAVVILFGLFFEVPAFLIGCGIHKLTNPNPTNPTKQIKPKKEPEKVKEVKKFNILNRKSEKVEKPSRFGEYEEQINDLRDEFETKDKVVRDLIEKRFEPPQITYTRFISLVDKSGEIFNHEAQAALDIIGLATEDSPRIESELSSKVKILNSIIDKIDDLTNELILSMDSSKDDDVDNLIDDMEGLIDSVKDYGE